MTAKKMAKCSLPPCPLCGAKCWRNGEEVVCSGWTDTCDYAVYDARTHRAICRALAARGKQKVLAKGYLPDPKKAICGHGCDAMLAAVCAHGKTCRRILVVEDEGGKNGY
jgi:hypothetical protein